MESLEPRCLLASLGGEVFIDADANGQKGPLETGAADVRVYVDANDNRILDNTELFADTDALGQYSFDNLPAGDHIIRMVTSPVQAQTSPTTYFGTGYAAGGDGSGTNPTQLFEMSLDGIVRPIGTPTTDRINGLVRTNEGVFLGVDANTNSVYSIDPVTGQELLLDTSNMELVFGLAYDPVTDTTYTLARDSGSSDPFRLHAVDQVTGQIGPAIGPGLDGLTATSDLAFDTVNQRIVGYDNFDNQFFEFQTNGIARSLSVADQPLNSWSLAFNGTSFVMFDQGDPAFTSVVTVDPDSGAVTTGFDASQRIPTEALFHAKRGDVAHRVTLTDSPFAVIANFGVTDVFTASEPANNHPTVISEILVDPLFGDRDVDQLLEIRGLPNGQLNPKTYFVIVDEENNEAGIVHGIFDLSGQSLGSNGFLTIVQQNSPHQINSESAVLRSTAPGFGGLPGDIYTDAFATTDRIDSTIVGANSYFLIESKVAPALGDDIDLDNDGLIDADGIFSNWTVLDSVSMHPFVGSGDQAYGQILLAEQELSQDPTTRTVAPGTPIVVTRGSGYAARVGGSVGSDADDWIHGTAEPDANVGAAAALQLSSFGPNLPMPHAFLERNLDHFGEHNFVGGVRGTIELLPGTGETDLNGNPIPPQPAAGLTVLADTNGNGVRDLITHVVEPDAGIDPLNLVDINGFALPQPLTNFYPGVTLSTAGTDNLPISFEVRSTREFDLFSQTNNRLFSHVDIPFFLDIRKLRFDFYSPVSEVSIDAMGPQSGSTPHYGRIEAYNADDELIGFDLSGPLVGRLRETITVESGNHDIAYAIAYSDTDSFLTSDPFGRYDRFTYKQLEPAAVTDENGQFEIKNLFPGQYDVSVLRNEASSGLIGAVPQRITVSKNENFVIGDTVFPNTAPEMDPEFAFAFNENLPGQSSLGFISASDRDGQELRYQLLAGEGNGVLLNEITGELTVAPDAILDFETTSEIRLTVGATDSLATTTTEVTLTVMDINEAPAVEETVFFVAEDTPNNTTLGQIEALDPDTEQNQTLTFEILGGSGVGIFDINPSNGLISLIDQTAIDFEVRSEHDLTVRVSDDGDPLLFTEITQIIQVIDQNDPPVISTTEFLIPEDALNIDEDPDSTVAQVGVVDPDLTQTHTFELIDGTGAAVFGITRTGGIFLRPGVKLDFEETDSYTLRVITIDSGLPPLADDATLTLTIGDVNEPPSLDVLTAMIPENSVGGTSVAAVSVIDPENSGSAYTVDLLNEADASSFEFDPTTNQISVADGAVLDFETQPIHTLRLQITDPTEFDAPTIVDFLVELTNVNDPPIVVTQDVTISELAAPGSIVGQLEVQILEPDNGDEVTVAIVGGNAADRFDLDPNSRILRVADGAQFDADGNPDPLSIQVEVTDSGGLSSVGTINVILNDVNEPPVFLTGAPVIPPLGSGDAFEFVIPPDAIVDPEGRSFQLSIFDENGGLPDWLEFDPESQTLIGLPTPEMLGQFPLTLRAFEPGPLDLFNELSFTLVVERGDTPLTNQRDPLDVDANGDVAPIDALRIINYMSRHGAGVSVDVVHPFTGFVDASGDGFVTARDALLVINGIDDAGGLAEQVGSGDDDDQNQVNDDALTALLQESSLF